MSSVLTLTSSPQTDLLLIRLSKFSWADSFWDLNGHLIKRYRKCKTAEQVMQVQEQIQAEVEAEKIERKKQMSEYSNPYQHVGTEDQC